MKKIFLFGGMKKAVTRKFFQQKKHGAVFVRNIKHVPGIEVYGSSMLLPNSHLLPGWLCVGGYQQVIE